MSESLIFIGMDVHQDTVTLAVFEGASKEAAVVKKLSSDLRKLAWAAHPERFVSGEPKLKPLPEAVWINPPSPTLTTQEIAL